LGVTSSLRDFPRRRTEHPSTFGNIPIDKAHCADDRPIPNGYAHFYDAVGSDENPIADPRRGALVFFRAQRCRPFDGVVGLYLDAGADAAEIADLQI